MVILEHHNINYYARNLLTKTKVLLTCYKLYNSHKVARDIKHSKTYIVYRGTFYWSALVTEVTIV